MNKIITTAEGITFTEPELVAGLGVNWNTYRPAIVETALNNELLPTLAEIKADAEQELAELRAVEAKKSVARKALERIKESWETLSRCARELGVDNADMKAIFQGVPRICDRCKEQGMYATDPRFRADEEMITQDIAFIDALSNFLKKDNELDKLLYAFHMVDLKYKKKLFKECYRRLVEVLEFIHTAERLNSVIKKAARGEAILDHLRGCRVIYENLYPGFKVIKKQLAKGDLSCLRDDGIGAMDDRDAEAYTMHMVERELAQEK